jgi:DNA-binding NarL/FixJ family response regulator
MTATASQQPNSTGPHDLTPKEVEVIYLLFNPEIDLSDIARKLFVTRSAVSQHTVSIYSKLQVSSRFEAICKYAQMDDDYRQAFFNFLKFSEAA